jgi:hypothetical protein
VSKHGLDVGEAGQLPRGGGVSVLSQGVGGALVEAIRLHSWRAGM